MTRGRVGAWFAFATTLGVTSGGAPVASSGPSGILSGVRILIATRGFAHPGGSETYALTVAEQFERLGHEVVIVGAELGPFAEFARERGLEVRGSLDGLEPWPDAALVQDSIVAYELAERLPTTPQLFRAPSDLHDMSLPPGLPGMVSDVVVCSDRVGRRIAALSSRPAVHRLRQPVDTERFMPAGVPATSPRRAVLLGNYLRSDRLRMVRDAFERLGVSIHRLGALGELDFLPERAIWDADIVVAKGRAALEGMACGRPVLVYDEFGGDGWVTPDRYPAMEADNFAGLSGPPIADRDQLVEELSRYDRQMGVANRELVLTHHGARAHAQRLCELLEGVDPPRRVEGAPLRELSRLVGLQWRAEMRAVNFEAAGRRLSEQAARAGQDAAQATGELAETRRRADALQAEADLAHGARDEAERERIRLADELARTRDELDRLAQIMRTRRVRSGLFVGRVSDSVLRRAVR